MLELLITISLSAVLPFIKIFWFHLQKQVSLDISFMSLHLYTPINLYCLTAIEAIAKEAETDLVAVVPF